MDGKSFSRASFVGSHVVRIGHSHRTDRVTARFDLCNDPRLVLIAPLPPTTGSSEDFQPPDRLRDSIIHCVHSKPNGQNQTADSQINPPSDKVAAKQRLP
jgi:hypothetical protein